MLPKESILASAGRGWDRFWFSPADPTTLAFIRILGGLLVFYVHLTYSWGLLSYVGPDSWWDKSVVDWIRRDQPIYCLDLGWNDNQFEYTTGNHVWSVFFHVTEPGWIIALHVFFLASMLLFAAGLWTRYTGLIAWVGAMSYVQRASFTVFGLDTMMMIVLLYLQIGPSGATWSLDRWLEVSRARARGEPVPPVEPSVPGNFAVRLIQFHFAFIYIASGTSKLLGSTWWSATSLNYVFLNPDFAPLDWGPYYHAMKFLAQNRWAWEVVMSAHVVGTLVLELGLIFLVWDSRWRWLLVCGVVGLHSGIAYIMGLTTFSLMMMIMAAAYFPPEALKLGIPEIGRSLRWLFTGDKADAPPARREMAGAAR